jgi:CubicO group peptidase (beta-lactamase class C family)
MRLFLLLLFPILALINEPQDSLKADQKLNNYNLKSHESLVRFKHKNKVPGLAFALFNGNETIFSECMGNSTYGLKINDETVFSIQSISKNVTALAVMTAVQDSLLNLDTPIIEYLPTFRVSSCFEDSPEQKITLRMLLSHRAGFTHEAPVGNSYDLTPCDIRDHIGSISNTWLRFPVGTNYSYSNLGFDLVSEIISRKTGISFNDYLELKIFQPLSMIHTTTDDKVVVLNKNRTEGNINAVKNAHYSIPLQGSGAVYTNLTDFIKYARLLMNYGETSDKTLIDRKYLYEMFRINSRNYGLGTYLDKSDDIFYVNHNGGGIGYSATLLWFPEYNLGSVILCNKRCSTFDICLSVMKEYIKTIGLSKDASVTALFEDLNGNYFKNKTTIDSKKVFTFKCDTIFRSEWGRYIGTYILETKGMKLKWWAKFGRFFGLGYDKVKILKEGEALIMTGSQGKSILKEFKPGLFFTDDNEALDLRTATPAFRNILLYDSHHIFY